MKEDLVATAEGSVERQLPYVRSVSCKEVGGRQEKEDSRWWDGASEETTSLLRTRGEKKRGTILVDAYPRAGCAPFIYVSEVSRSSKYHWQ